MKLKYLIFLTAMIISTVGFSQEKKSFKGFYAGYNTENKTYSFEAVDGVNTTFVQVVDSVLNKYDLSSSVFIDKPFSVIYTIKKNEDNIKEYTIVSLKPTALVRVDNEEDEEDDED